ncbi:hypothetical protein G6F60_015303 [Rhizopus arrhizus]|nr:hypothetical protein G6F60_015303 [Rhizopus arrhizus]
MPARCLNSSADRCGDCPAPELPKETLAGSCLARASRSATVRADEASFTTSTLGTDPMYRTAVKSRMGSMLDCTT